MGLRRKAFTLIELLVVIAIIALLLSIMMPALNKAKEKAQTVICRSSLKQLYYAAFMYADENDGRCFPQWKDGDYYLFVYSVLPYIGGADKLRSCPATKMEYRMPDLGWGSYGSARKAWIWGFGTAEYPLPASPGPKDYPYGSYGFNGWLYGDKDSSLDDRFFKKIDNVEYRFETPMFADSYWVDSGPAATDTLPAGFSLDNEHVPGIGDGAGGGGGMKRFMLNRHGDRISNVVFVDGHVAGVKLEDFWELKWHNGFQAVPLATRPIIPR